MVNEITSKVFWQLHSDLPREGPGSFEATEKALSYLKSDLKLLPEPPKILDIGCGPGMQTLHLATLTEGMITATDNHQPYLDRLSEIAGDRGLGDRIQVICADMSNLPLAAQSFDIIWSEGAIYIMGFDQGLKTWKSLLKPGGYLAITEITWLHSHPPEAVQKFWQQEYGAMRNTAENINAIKAAGYEIINTFTLPEQAWWNDYYHPLEQKISQLQEIYGDNSEALQVLKREQEEIELYRQYSQYYGYVFYIAKCEENGE